MFLYLHQEQATILLGYVDDIIVTRSSDSYIQELIGQLNSTFALK